MTLVQPDGATFSAVPWGNATLNGYEDTRGYTVARDASGTWRYTQGRKADGTAALTDVRPDRARPPAGAAPHERPAQPTAPSAGPTAAPGAPAQAPHVPHQGQAPSLVILAQFADQSNLGTTPGAWSSRFFGASNSVADFYDEVSYGKLDLAPAAEASGTANDGVVGWVTLPMNHPNPGSPESNADYANSHRAVREALLAADPFVNYASYDADGDGVIEPRELHLTIVLAGYETSFAGKAAACGKSFWGHRWQVGGYGVEAPLVDGKTAGGAGYQMFGEFHCSTGDRPGHQATIGIMAHELGHDLNMPDLYDLDQSSGGVGEWSLMSGGVWNSVAGQLPGTSPAQLDPFTRSYQGWVTPTQVTGTNVATSLAAVETSPSVVRVLPNPNGIDWSFDSQSGTGEYFLVENRQKIGYDAALPGCGVLIWHVDETRTSTNEANKTDERRLVDLEEADGLAQIDEPRGLGDDGDPYPGSQGKTLFSDTANPDARLYSGAASGVSVRVPNGSCSNNVNLTVSGPAAPANDAFSAATALSGASGSTAGSNVGAGKEAGEPAHAGNDGGASVWWRWTAPSNGTLDVSLAGSDFDTTLGVYSGSSVTSLTQVAANDDAVGFASAVQDIPVTAGTTYRIAVDGYDGASGQIDLGWTFSSTGPSGSAYASITPCRVVDTRAPGAGGAFAAGQQRSFQVSGTGSGFATQGGTAGGCAIPAGAVAVEATITAVVPTGTGFTRAWPAGTTQPNATFLNFTTGQSIGNTGTIPITTTTATADLALQSYAAGTHIVIDIQGYFFRPS